MKPGTDTLTLIRTSFPGRNRVIERAFRDNQSFRDLCEDYRRCVAALHRWRRLQAAEAPARWQEYSDLLIELGRDIQTWLDAVETGTSQSSEGSR